MGSQTNICAICGANYRADVLFCPQDGAPLGTAAPRAHDAFIGVELPGRIRIDKLIGIGAAGRVYRGFQGGVDRPVAIKVLHAELSNDATVVSRFHREARVTSMLAHPHVVEVFVTGEMPSGGPGAGALCVRHLPRREAPSSCRAPSASSYSSATRSEEHTSAVSSTATSSRKM
jgi:eukaryotic-like serine/threonine-protein kinase